MIVARGGDVRLDGSMAHRLGGLGNATALANMMRLRP
jgi:hypothetical protein